MTPTSFTNVQEAATALDLKINVLQNSAGVLSDVDQAALTDIETASKHLLQTVNDLTRFQPKSAGQIEAIIQDRAVRPGETPAEHTARMQRDYPYNQTTDQPTSGRLPHLGDDQSATLRA